MVVSRLLLVILLLRLAPACASDADSPAISVRPVDDESWELVYRFEEPIRGLKFADAAGFMREKRWEIKTPHYRFERGEKGGQLLLADSPAKASRCVTLVFPTETRPSQREHELFNVFTDASTAFFTRYFYVMPYDPAATERQIERFVADIQIAPKPDQHVVILGEKSSGPMRWRDQHTRGTYAYTGTLEPVTSEYAIMILDPGLPAWVFRIAERSIPALLEIYTERIGRPLEQKPMVLFSYEPGGAEGYSYNGGVVGNLLQLRIQGLAWEYQSAEMALELTQYIANQVAHFWDGQVAQQDKAKEKVGLEDKAPVEPYALTD